MTTDKNAKKKWYRTLAGIILASIVVVATALAVVLSNTSSSEPKSVTTTITVTATVTQPAETITVTASPSADETASSTSKPATSPTATIEATPDETVTTPPTPAELTCPKGHKQTNFDCYPDGDETFKLSQSNYGNWVVGTWVQSCTSNEVRYIELNGMRIGIFCEAGESSVYATAPLEREILIKNSDEVKVRISKTGYMYVKDLTTGEFVQTEQ